jgi:hypothetical protein
MGVKKLDDSPMSDQENPLPDWVLALLQKEVEFENVTYPDMIWEEKQNFWIGDFPSAQVAASSGACGWASQT